MRRSRALIVAVLLGAAATLAACSSAPDVAPTGHTTTVTVTAQGMTFSPDRIEVPAGDRLVVEFENADTQVHDITFGNGKASSRLASGEAETVEVGVVGADMQFWCSIAGHREQGMEGDIVVE